MTKEKIYLYMAKRDKKGFNLLTIFQGEEVHRTRVKNIDDLQLPVSLATHIKKTVYDNRFQWEVWIESAPSFIELNKRLKKRGYQNLVSHAIPKHPVTLDTIVSNPDEIKEIRPNINKIQLKKKTMLKRR